MNFQGSVRLAQSVPGVARVAAGEHGTLDSPRLLIGYFLAHQQKKDPWNLRTQRQAAWVAHCKGSHDATCINSFATIDLHPVCLKTEKDGRSGGSRFATKPGWGHQYLNPSPHNATWFG